MTERSQLEVTAPALQSITAACTVNAVCASQWRPQPGTAAAKDPSFKLQVGSDDGESGACEFCDVT